MTRFAFLFALAALVAVAGCDTQTETMEEEEEVVTEPIFIEYQVNGPDSITDFAIEYTDAEGNAVFETYFNTDRVTFPVTIRVDNLPADTEGTFTVGLQGTLTEGIISAQVTARQDGLNIADDRDTSTLGASGFVKVSADVTLPVVAD